MPIQKDNSKKGKVSFSPQDFTSEKDCEYNFIHTTDLEGNQATIDLWSYAAFFYDKIQYKKLSKEQIYIDGLRLDKFMSFFIKEKLFSNLEDYIMESTCFGFQQEMEEKYGTHINWFALYALCMYVREIINRRLVALLKPSFKETLEEVSAMDSSSTITFELDNGKRHSTNNPLLFDSVKKSLQSDDEDTYVLDKITRKVDVYSKEYGQIEFVRYISAFFHEYFNIKRRKNSYLTSTEQRIICFLLKFFEFTPEIVQESRFRQLFSNKYRPVGHFIRLAIPGYFESNVYIHLEILTYSEWKNGRINPLTHKHSENAKEHFSLNMGENPDLSELIKVAQGLLEYDHVDNPPSVSATEKKGN